MGGGGGPKQSELREQERLRAQDAELRKRMALDRRTRGRRAATILSPSSEDQPPLLVGAAPGLAFGGL